MDKYFEWIIMSVVVHKLNFQLVSCTVNIITFWDSLFNFLPLQRYYKYFIDQKYWLKY